MSVGPTGHNPTPTPNRPTARMFRYDPMPINPITPELLLGRDRVDGAGPIEIHPDALPAAQAQAGGGQALIDGGVAAPAAAPQVAPDAAPPVSVGLGGAATTTTATAAPAPSSDIPLTQKLPTAPSDAAAAGMKVIPAKSADHFLKALPAVVLTNPVKPGTVLGGGPGTKGGGPTGTTNMKPAGKRWDHSQAQGVSVDGAMITFPPFAESAKRHQAPRVVFGPGWIPKGDGRTYVTSSGAKAKVGIHPRLSVPTGADWTKVRTKYGSGKKLENGWIVGMGKDGKPYALSPNGKFKVLKPGFHNIDGIKVRSFYASVVNVTYPDGRFIRYDSRGNARQGDDVGKPGAAAGGGAGAKGGGGVSDPAPAKGAGKSDGAADPAPGKGGSTGGGGPSGLDDLMSELMSVIGELAGVLGLGDITGGGLGGMLGGLLGGDGAAGGAGLLGGGGLLGGLTGMLGGAGLAGGDIDRRLLGNMGGILDKLKGLLPAA